MKKIVIVITIFVCNVSFAYTFTVSPSWNFGRVHLGGLFQKSTPPQLSLTASFFEFSVKDTRSGFGFECSPFYFSGINKVQKNELFLLNASIFYNTLEKVTNLCMLSPFAGFRWCDVRNFRAYRVEAGLEFLFTPSASPFSEWKIPLVFKIVSVRSGVRLDNQFRPAFFCEAGIDLAVFIYGGAKAATVAQHR